MDQNNVFLSPPRASRNPRPLAGGRGTSKNKLWVNGTRTSSTSPAGSNRKLEKADPNGSVFKGNTNGTYQPVFAGESSNVESDDGNESNNEKVNGHVKTWEELVKAREAERVQAIKEGRLDDPEKRHSLDQAITLVGTCQDMCPEYERYRRERENNLDKLECIIGPDGKPTRKVDHKRAVKIYERGQGDKIVPSDLRPPPVLKRTLDYLFHDVISQVGFLESQAFVRDRSRAVRNDFTIQRERGPIAIECHERCARFHVLSLYKRYDVVQADQALELQQLMNSLLSLKEFYEDQRGNYDSPNELEMRAYLGLGLIRNQHDRNEGTPPHILNDPIFQLISRFRSEAQAASQPITKTSQMIAGDVGKQTLSEIYKGLEECGNNVMMYLIACLLKYIFGPGLETDDKIQQMRGRLTDQDITDGVSVMVNNNNGVDDGFLSDDDNSMMVDETLDDAQEFTQAGALPSSPLKSQATQWLNSNFGSAPVPTDPTSFPFGQANNTSTFLASSAPTHSNGNVFTSNTSSPQFAGTSIPDFNKPVASASTASVFGNSSFSSRTNVFGGPVFGSKSMPAKTTAPSVFVTSSSNQPTTEGQGSNVKLSDFPAVSFNTNSTVQPPPLQPYNFEVAPKSSTSLNPSVTTFIPRVTQESPPTSAPFPQAISSTPEYSTHVPLSAIPGKFNMPFSTSPTSVPKTSSPLSINTGQSVDSQLNSHKLTTIDSPLEPPRLNRAIPISLPGTPTVGRFSGFPSTAISDPTKPMSPLITFSPAPPRSPFPVSPGNSRLSSSSTAQISQPDITHPIASTSKLSNGFSVPKKTKEELQKEADVFAQRSSVVRNSFMRWKSKAMDIAAWKEACQRSDVYKMKSSQNGEISISPATKRRRVTSGTPSKTVFPQRRMKRKKAEPMQSFKDEELAQRFKENYEEHERRWAEGSFLDSLRKRLSKSIDQCPPHWRVWLCTNPDNDQTAIWLDQKFAVPSSGNWESDAIFSIPISSNPSTVSHPGLIVFECVPLEGINDDLERKYRILDDCSRLRDIIAAFPEERHFVPAILVVVWADANGNSMPNDLTETLKKLEMEGTIGSHSYFSITSQDRDLDDQFVNILDPMKLDVQGMLVDRLTLSELFTSLVETWRGAASVWLHACGSDDRFNWKLFDYVLRTFFQALSFLIVEILVIWEPGRLPPLPLVPPDFEAITDAASAQSVLEDWLRFNKPPDAVVIDGFIINDETLLDHLSDVALYHMRQYTSAPFERRVFPKTVIAGLKSRFGHSLDEFSSELRKLAKSLPRSYGKRRQADSDLMSDFGSRTSSPAPSTPEYPAKRPRRSDASETSFEREDLYSPAMSPTPSLTTSVADSTSSVVTVSMLRALARDVLKGANSNGVK